MKTTRRKQIQQEADRHNDNPFGPGVYVAMVESRYDRTGWLDFEFDNGYGTAEGPRFFLWSEKRVYFSVQYDGAEDVESVPREPTDEAPRVFGGG